MVGAGEWEPVSSSRNLLLTPAGLSVMYGKAPNNRGVEVSPSTSEPMQLARHDGGQEPIVVHKPMIRLVLCSGDLRAQE